MKRRKRTKRVSTPRTDSSVLSVGASVALAIVILAAVGCEPYRIEYRKRPEFHRQAVRGGVEEQVVLDDGTILVNVFGDDESELQRRVKSTDKPFKIREENEDGSVTLRAIVPLHVLQNTYTCIKNEEYDLLWDQMLSHHAQVEMRDQGRTFDDFAAYFAKHRYDLARTLNRMILESARQGTTTQGIGNGVIEIRLRPHLAQDFKFTKVRVISEGPGLKLLMIS